jgi:exonuclease SbcC
MLPVRLEIRNFLAYRSPDPVRFDGIHLACLTGANGAGKSSLLDAVTWALWGKARARRDEELVHLGQNDMYVQLDFVHEGVTYRVLRRRTRKSGGQGTLDLFILNGDGPKTISEGSARATQSKINTLLRLDYETFVHSAFLQQGKADAFTTKAPGERKKILSDILGLERWETYEDAAKEQVKKLNETLAGVEAVIRQIDEELSREPALRKAVADAEIALKDAQEKLDAADARARELEHAPKDLELAQARKAETEQRLKERERERDTAGKLAQERRARVNEHQTVIAARDDIEAGYSTLQAARAADHTLGDKLMQLSQLDAQRAALFTRREAARSDLQKEASGYRATITQLERTIAAASPDELSAVQAEVLALQDIEAERDQTQDAIVALERESGEHKSTNEKLRVEMVELKERIDRLSRTSGAECPLCGQPLSEAHRLELLEQLQAQGKNWGDTFRANTARMETIVRALTEHKAQVQTFTVELKRLATLKERAAALQTSMDAANDARTRMSEAQARLNAVEARLNADDFAHDLRTEIAALDEARTALGYDSAAHNAARQQLQTYQEYETRQKRLELALASLPDAQTALEAAEEHVRRLATAIDEDRAALEKIGADIAALTALVQEFRSREQEAALLRTQERTANNRLVVAQQELRALETQQERKRKQEELRETHRRDKVLYEELRLAFGKNGIPAMIIETVIPELETTANDLLSRMTDGRMHITLTTQREKVTGGVAETLDIQIADELGTRAYEMFSGGEAFRINFAIRVALSQLLARRAGAHLTTLFIDEGFGTQDEDGRNKLVEAITAVQDDFDMILVITHIDELRDSFPVHIMLEKTGDGSRISVR